MAFITGSHAYGIPHAKSDIDLVVMVSQKDLERLLAIAGDQLGNPDYEVNTTSVSLNFGDLNLLVCTTQEQYDLWARLTRELKAKAPVPREFAVKYFAKLRGLK